MEIYVRFVREMLSPAVFHGEPTSDESLINGHEALDIMIICFLQLFWTRTQGIG